MNAAAWREDERIQADVFFPSEPATRTWMFGHVLLKLPPGGCEDLAVGVGAAVTCTDGTVRSTSERKRKVTLFASARRPSEEPRSSDTIHPENVALREKVTCKYSRSPVLIKELCRQELQDPCWEGNGPTCVLLLVGSTGRGGAELGSTSGFGAPKRRSTSFNLREFLIHI